MPVDSHHALESALTHIRALHPKARHHCYAYRFLTQHEITEYMSDAGEPSGSAGQPILGVLRKHELLNLCIVVVRYFGGTKLGIPGLINAYRESASDAVQAGSKITVTRTEAYEIEMPLALQPMFYSACKQTGVEISSVVYNERLSANILVPLEHHTRNIEQMLMTLAGRDGNTIELCQWLNITLQMRQK
jgi:uncharacterized YigZ family protein